MIEGLGLVIAVVGLAMSVGLFETFADTKTLRPLMLAIALVLACLCTFAGFGDDRRPTPASCLLAGFYLAAGLLALWRFPAEIGADAGTHAWAGLLGCAAMLIATWRIWGAPLAIAGLVALVYSTFWRLNLDLAATAPIAVHEVGYALWSSWEQGALGWLIDACLSPVLPFFLLGGVLAGQSTFETPDVERDAGRQATAIQAGARFLVPTMVLGALIVTERPGLSLSTMAPAWLGLVAVGIAWFWIMPSAAERAAGITTHASPDLALIGVAAGAFLLAAVSGLPLAGSAIVALAVVIALSFKDADVRGRPTIILHALARSGVAFGKLLLAACTLGMILAVLDRTGLPFDLAQILAAVAGEAWLPLILLSAVIAIAFSLVAPGLAAYLIAVALLGPSLRTVGLSDLAIHLPILFLCAGTSAIITLHSLSEIGT